MPNNFFKSTEVKLYPAAYRGYTADNKLYNPESRLPSENNLSNISYYLTQKREGFVVSKEGNEVVFVLKGYQFRVDISSITTWPKNYLWVAIKLKARGNISDTTNTDYADYSLDTFKTVTGVESGSTNSDVLDDGTADGDFCALVYDFADSVTVSPFDNDTYSLCICFKSGTKIAPPKSSQLMLKTNHIENASSHEPLTNIFEHEMGLNEKSVSIKALGEFDAHDLTDNFSPTQDTTNEIHVLSDMAQNSIGKITPTEKTLPLASDSTAGLVSSDSTNAQKFKGEKQFDAVKSPTIFGNFGTCATLADTAAKIVHLDNFTPAEGCHIFVLFEKRNNTLNPTLTITSSDEQTTYLSAKEIYVKATTGASKEVFNSWNASDVVEFIYNNNKWRIVGTRTSDVPISTCSTAAGTANKVVISTGYSAGEVANIDTNGYMPNFKVENGAHLVVYFENGNTNSAPQLRFNGTNYAISGDSKAWHAGELIEFVYYGGVGGSFYALNKPTSLLVMEGSSSSSDCPIPFNTTKVGPGNNKYNDAVLSIKSDLSYQPSTSTLKATNINASGNISAGTKVTAPRFEGKADEAGKLTGFDGYWHYVYLNPTYDTGDFIGWDPGDLYEMRIYVVDSNNISKSANLGLIFFNTISSDTTSEVWSSTVPNIDSGVGLMAVRFKGNANRNGAFSVMSTSGIYTNWYPYSSNTNTLYLYYRKIN